MTFEHRPQGGKSQQRGSLGRSVFLAEGTTHTEALSREQALCIWGKVKVQGGAGNRVGRDEVRKEIQILLDYLAAACNTY